MLKKRILASTMASVMALGSVSLVAFADDKVEAPKGESATKAELQAYIDSLADFLEDGVFDYGTIQSKDLQDAVDFAESVLDARGSTVDDYTAAYQMVKGVYEGLKMYTSDILKDMLDEYLSDYETDNIRNEELNDPIWDADDFAEFAEAYDYADKYADTNDISTINDACAGMEKTHKKLSEKSTITKAQFVQAHEEYEAIIEKLEDYEGWRRGTFTVNAKTGDAVKKAQKDLCDYYDWATYDALADLVKDDNVKIPVKLVDGTTKNYSWIKVGKNADGDNAASVFEYITTQYNRFDDVKTARVTSDADIIGAYNTAKDAIAVFNGWQADNTNRVRKAAVSRLIEDYNADMAVTFALERINDLVDQLNTAAGKEVVELDIDAKTLKAKDKFNLIVDNNTDKITVVDATKLYDASAAVGGDIVKKSITKKQDIMKYIPVYSDDITAYVGAFDTADADDAYSDITTATTGLGPVATKAADDAKAEVKFYNTTTAAAGTEGATGVSPYVEDVLLEIVKVRDSTATDLTGLTKADLDQYDELFTTTTVEKKDIEFPKKNATTSAWTDTDNTSVADKKYYKVTKTDPDAAYLTTNTDVADAFDTYEALTDAADEAYTNLSNGIATLREQIALVTIKNADGFAEFKALCEDLAKRLAGAEAYIAEDKEKSADQDFTDAYDSYVADIDENSCVTDPSANDLEGWTLLYRKLSYDLGDLFDTEAAAKKTKKEVYELIKKADELVEKTAEAAVFAEYHQDLVEARKAARQWYSQAGYNGFKDTDEVEYNNVSVVEEFPDGTSGDGMTAKQVYDKLNGYYKTLNKWFNAYAIGYDEILATIGTVGVGIDENAYGAKTDEIKNYLTKVAVGLSTLDAGEDYNVDEDANEPFDKDRNFLGYNRLHIAKVDTADESYKGPNDAEKQLKKDYDKLLALVEEATTAPAAAAGDVNGDGNVNLADAKMVLDAHLGTVTLTADQTKAGDMDGDGDADLADAKAILDAYLKV